MSYRLARLASEHDLSGFSSGQPELDEWLRTYAPNAAARGTRTYVLVPAGTDEVVGYFAIAPHLLERAAAPKRIGRGSPARIPAILLAKLALDRRLQGQGLGAELLLSALTVITDVARSAGGRLVVVDARDEQAAGFYAAHDFLPTSGDPHRLVIKLSTVAKALDLDWP